MESRHTSRYFFKRAGRKHNSRLWTKLAVACDTASHFFTAATVSLGPANDAPQFRPLMAQASLAVGYDRVLGDAAFDGEESHRYCREDLGVRSTVIPINRRNGGRKWPKTRYRRQMVKRFRKKPRGSRHKRVYGQRWQAESALLPTQAAARLGAAGQVGCVARTRVLPAGTHPQPHAPRRYRLEDFNRASCGPSDIWPRNRSRPLDVPHGNASLAAGELLRIPPDIQANLSRQPASERGAENSVPVATGRAGHDAAEAVRAVAAAFDRVGSDPRFGGIGHEQLIMDARRELTKHVYSYFDVNPDEEILIEDTVRVLQKSATPSRSSNIPTLAAPNASHRTRYANTLLDALHEWAGDTRGRLSASCVLSEKVGVGVLTIAKTRGLAAYSETRASADLEQALSRFRAHRA